MSESPSLYIKRITKKYPGYNLFVKDVEFPGGTFNSVLGPSGSGKSTFLRSLCGLTKASDIEVQLGNKVYTSSNDEGMTSQLAYIFQNYNLIPRVSVLHNVLLGNLVKKRGFQGFIPTFSRTEKLEALRLLDSVSLLPHAFKDVSELSGGQMQRVAIARALAKKPKVILADEPIASLDPDLSKTMLELFQSICIEHGVTIIATLHQPDFAYAFSSQIIRLVDGEVNEIIDCKDKLEVGNA